MPLRRIVPLRGTLSCAFGAALLQGPTRWDYLTRAFMPLRRIVPLQGTLSCAFGTALLQGPTRWGLSHIGFHTATTNCASSRHSILRLWRGPSSRAYSLGLSHMGFYAVTANCASPRHSILRLWRGPSPRAYSMGIISHGLSYRRRLTICLLFLQSLRRCAGVLPRGRF